MKAIIWDMDGVIIDSEPVHFASLVEFGRRHGFEYTETLDRQFTGTTDDFLFKTLQAQFNLPGDRIQMAEERKAIYLELLETSGVGARPGVVQLVKEAHARQILQAVASSSSRRLIERSLAIAGVHHLMDVIVSGDDVQRSKPDPEIFIKALGALGVLKEETIVIEDTINGIKAACAAGISVLSFPCEKTLYQDHSPATARVLSFEHMTLDKLQALMRPAS